MKNYNIDTKKTMKELLLNERWRPKTIEDMILLPRIKSIFESGLKQNVILHGHFGTGKTTLARILIGKWTKDKPFLEINSSFYTSIETLRTKIDDFCSTVYMGLDLMSDTKSDDMKYVFLDEFERTSIQYQDALKAYIEEYSTKNVRFILNTNHLDKISDGIKSRMITVNFDAQNTSEEKLLKRSMFIRIMDQICPAEKISISKESLIKIINDSFPDFRKVLNRLQNYSLTGDILQVDSVDEESKSKLYELIESTDNNYEEVFYFVSDKFGPDNIKELLRLLGTEYSIWCMKNSKEKVNNLFEINNLVSQASMQLEFSVDPIIVGLSLIGNIKKLK